MCWHSLGRCQTLWCCSAVGLLAALSWTPSGLSAAINTNSTQSVCDRIAPAPDWNALWFICIEMKKTFENLRKYQPEIRWHRNSQAQLIRWEYLKIFPRKNQTEKWDICNLIDSDWGSKKKSIRNIPRKTSRFAQKCWRPRRQSLVSLDNNKSPSICQCNCEMCEMKYCGMEYGAVYRMNNENWFELTIAFQSATKSHF